MIANLLLYYNQLYNTSQFFKGKQHKLGAKILLPDVCGALICEESLEAGSSPLLPGAVQHAVSHPEELTLNFVSLFPGRECCLLSENSTKMSNGSMVQEGEEKHYLL